ncbi:MAG TPA: twin-arginine translocation signal domain-containing protein, partial [Armatimonadota bacterium]|nr:twin-arginine translocation signal domain-containing protein [Armatimonadota bacterium]
MKIEWGPVRGNCAGVSRRDFLKIGALAGMGLTLPDLIRCRAAAAAEGRRPANVIFLFLDGGPSHLETFDLKPEAPA